MKKYFYLSFIILGFSGCIFSGDPLPQLWFYTYNEGPSAGRDSLLTPASFLELRKDGSYTRDFGHFEYGKWSRKGQNLYFTNQNLVTSVILLNKVSPKELKLNLNNIGLADFESQPFPKLNDSEDPYSQKNNEWRIPARQKETDKEIQKRLYNHCHFWETYFTWAMDNEIPTIDVRSTPTLIKIYGNGFGLKQFDELPAIWKSYFFDAGDCQKANHMIKNIFQSHTIAWAHTTNKYKLFISAFQQLEGFLE